MQQLEARDVPLHKVFSSDYAFQIPEYQRPYAWETDQAMQLLDDLVDALDRDDDEPYFLGSMVLVSQKGTAETEVIDGQQRLTTLTILFAVLRDLTDDDELRQALQDMIQQPGAVLLQLEPRPRLQLRAQDAEFFRTYVQESGGIPMLLELKRDALATDAQRAIQTNSRALHDAVGNWTAERRLGLLRLISARTFLVLVSTPDLGSAHRIFSVMNSRGLDLSPADIFKAQIIGAMPSTISGTYARTWEDSEQDLRRDDFADLFLDLRLIVSKERAKQELLREFPRQVLSAYLPDRAPQFVDEVVVPYAKAYGQVRDRSYTATSGAERVNGWFRRLAMIDNKDWRPPTLWALRHRGDDPAWLDAFLRNLERLAASMFVRREYTTNRVNRYIEVLKQLEEGPGPDLPAFDLSDAERSATLEVLNGEVYRSTKTRKYVLLRLDETLANSPGVTYDLPVITVEHVLPQNPGADSAWRDRFDDDQREAWTHRLANLVLLNRYKNSEAQNYDFETKKDRYFAGKNGIATFALTVQVLQTAEWTPALLERRQAQLLAVLAKAWRL